MSVMSLYAGVQRAVGDCDRTVSFGSRRLHSRVMLDFCWPSPSPSLDREIAVNWRRPLEKLSSSNEFELTLPHLRIHQEFII